MEIILKEDVVNLGYKNDIVTVKSGYGRNYLIPTGKAVIASPSAKKMLAEELKQRAHKLLSRTKILKPCSPMTSPASIIPIMCGIRSLFNNMGANNIMRSTRRNIHVGSVMGSFKLKSNQSIGYKF